MHSVEKIGGTSMNDYRSVRDNVVLGGGDSIRRRIFVVSAYGGITDQLLEHKKSGQPGVYALFASSTEDRAWLEKLQQVRKQMLATNRRLFGEGALLRDADTFIGERLDDAMQCLRDLQRLCQHGHFALDTHLKTVREMLASLGEAHSAWNTTQLLRRDGVNACFIDLTGWRSDQHIPLDSRILQAFEGIDLDSQVPIVTGYAHSDEGLMLSFDRGYSEMTFSRIAVLTGAREAIIYKEFHLSSADPRLVGETKAVPIGRTNYDVADQLANLGMEAIHPKAAQGLRQQGIPLRVKNTFEPEHAGTLITVDYVSETPRVEIIAGCRGVYAIQLFDQEMAGKILDYDREFLGVIQRLKAPLVAKDMNANTITHFVSGNLRKVKNIIAVLRDLFPGAELDQQQVAMVSAIGSDMKIPGVLAQTVQAIASRNISVLAVHQSMRQVDIQFVVQETDYEETVRVLHESLVEVHDHGQAISLVS